MKIDFKKSKVVFLHPGEAVFSKNPIVVSTVLGSCVSITMYSSRIKYAGISHCQLPKCPHAHGNCNQCEDPFKFVDCTIHKMLDKFRKRNVMDSEIEIKLFGGGDVLATIEKKGGTSTVGQKNISKALETLNKLNLKTAAKDVGGKTGRKIFFVTDSGDVYLNRLKNYEED